MKPKYLWAVATVVAAAAAAMAGTGAIAADRYSFHPPPGWQRAPVLTSRLILASWMDPSGSGQNINIASEKFSGSLASMVQVGKATLKRALPDVTFGDTAYGKTCGNHPAAYFASQSTMGGRVLIFEQVSSVWFGWGYTVTYTRRTSDPMNDQARASLTSLCVFSGKPAVPAAPALPGAGGSPAVAASPTPLPTAAPTATPGGYYTAAPAPTSTIGVPAPTSTP